METDLFYACAVANQMTMQI